MLLNSSVNPAFKRIPMIALDPARADAFPPELLIPGRPKGRVYSNIAMLQIADWILRTVNQKTIQKEWKTRTHGTHSGSIYVALTTQPIYQKRQDRLPLLPLTSSCQLQHWLLLTRL